MAKCLLRVRASREWNRADAGSVCENSHHTAQRAGSRAEILPRLALKIRRFTPRH